MKQKANIICKRLVRALMAVGAMLGLTSCPGPVECVYGPPPMMDTTQVQEDYDDGSEQSVQHEDASRRHDDAGSYNSTH